MGTGSPSAPPVISVRQPGRGRLAGVACCITASGITCILTFIREIDGEEDAQSQCKRQRHDHTAISIHLLGHAIPVRFVSLGEHRLGVQEIGRGLFNVVEWRVPEGFCHQLNKLEPHDLSVTVVVPHLDESSARLVCLRDEDEGEQPGHLPSIASVKSRPNNL